MEIRRLSVFGRELFRLNHVADQAADLLVQVLQKTTVRFLAFEDGDGQRLHVNLFT